MFLGSYVFFFQQFSVTVLLCETFVGSELQFFLYCCFNCYIDNSCFFLVVICRIGRRFFNLIAEYEKIYIFLVDPVFQNFSFKYQTFNSYHLSLDILNIFFFSKKGNFKKFLFVSIMVLM